MALTSIRSEFIISWNQQLELLQQITDCDIVFIVQTIFPVSHVLCSTRPSHKYYGNEKVIADDSSIIKSYNDLKGSICYNAVADKITYLEEKLGYKSIIFTPLRVNAKYFGGLVLLSTKDNLTKKNFGVTNTIATTISHQIELIKSKSKTHNVITGDATLIKRLQYVLKTTDTTLNIVDGKGNIIFHSHKNIDDIEGSCFMHFRDRHEMCDECPRRKLNISKSIYTYYSLDNNKTYQATAVPFNGDNGETYMAEIRVDISDRAKAEREVAELKDLLEFSMIAGQIAFLEYDLIENKIKTNEYFERITGYSFKNAKVNIHWILSRIYPEDAKRIKRLFFRSKNKINNKLDFDFRLLNAHNKYLWFRYSGKIIEVDEDSFPARISGIVSDITSLKSALNNLMVEQSKTIEASKAKSIFLANISHEIRTPMNAILGFSDLLSMHITNPPYDAYLRSIKSSGNILLSLINDLLDFEKLDADKMQLRQEFVDFEVIVHEIEQTFLMLANENELTIKVVKPLSFPETIKLDAVKIKQVLINLVNNAIKFTKIGGVTITYGWFQKPEEVKGKLIFTVADTGIGIKKERQENIFDPFSQDDDINKKDQKGTGLGLSIVQKIVKMMGGSVTLKSEVGIGSTFTIYIPDLEVSSKMLKESELHSNFHFNNELILLISEDESNIGLIEAYCKKNELNLVNKSVTEDTLSFEFLLQFRLIIIDINRSIDFSLLKSLNSNIDNVPIILLQSNVAVNIPLWLKSASVLLHIPFSESNFKSIISKFITPHYIFGEPQNEYVGGAPIIL